MFPGHALVPSGQNITNSEYNHGFSFADASFAAELRQVIQDQKDLADNLLNQDADQPCHELSQTNLDMTDPITLFQYLCTLL